MGSEEKVLFKMVLAIVCAPIILIGWLLEISTCKIFEGVKHVFYNS